VSDPIERFAARENAWVAMTIILGGCGALAYFTDARDLGVAGVGVAIATVLAVAVVGVDLWCSFFPSDIGSATKRRFLQLGIAIVIAAFGATVLSWLILNGRVGQLYATGIGERATVSLPDGTVVTLNTDTLMRVRYRAGLRLVALEHGEARFAVGQNKNVPFEVNAGPVSTRALGTAFSVHVRAEGLVDVLVTEGAVEIRAAAGEPRSATAGDLIEATPRGTVLRRLEDTEIRRRLRWQEGKLTFGGEPLEEVIREVNRYQKQQFVIVDPKIAQIPIGGTFNVGDLGAIVEALRMSRMVVVTVLDSERVELRSSSGR
jgi:transmembrane sensor